jgi:hypothetical protein
VAITGLEDVAEDHCYRAMDLLVEADTKGKVQDAVFFACADLLNLEVDLLFFDTTSTYFCVTGLTRPASTVSRVTATARITAPTCRR